MDLDNLQTFYGLFSQYRFHIPDYQRGYSWEESQWKALMDDLSTLTNHNDHFTGLLVLHENKDPNFKIKVKGVLKDVYDLVDGQQRLTTIVILLNEIRKAMKKIDDEDLNEIADDITPLYLYEPGPGNMLVPKLVLDRNNHDFFVSNILGINNTNLLGAEIHSHSNLLRAQSYFCNYLADKKAEVEDRFPEWLAGLYEKIVNQMKVMVYKLRSEADAGVVFESMNNRGKKPNQLDLVKNYLLFLASKLGAEMKYALTDSINCTWEVIFKQLTFAKRTEDEETLLQMHWLTVYDHDLKRWVAEGENKSNLIKRRFSLLNYLDQYEQLYQELEKYVQTLRNAAVAYADLHMPEERSAISFPMLTRDPVRRKQIITSSQKLRRIGFMRPFIPLLMAVRLRFPEDAEKYLETIRLCELYSFRVFNVAERRNTSKEAFLFRVGNQLFNVKINFDTMSEEIRRDLLQECPDSLLKYSFAVENAVPWYGKRGLTYFLYEYEENLFGPNEPVINWQTIHEGGERSIEHILPQNPEETGYWVDLFQDEDERKRLTHQVGNLTLVLVGENSALGRKAFPEKKGVIGQGGACYSNCDLKITRELAGLSDWTPKTLISRQNTLSDWAMVRWHVDEPPEPPNEPWEAKLARARRDGVELEFLELRSIAEKLYLALLISKNAVAYKSKYNLLLSAITVRTYENYLEVYVRPHNIPVPKGFSKERIKEILGEEQRWGLRPADFGVFRSRFDQLLFEIDAYQK